MLLERKEPVESHVCKLGNMGSVNMHFYLYHCFIVNTRSIIKFASENGSNTQLPLYLHSYVCSQQIISDSNLSFVKLAYPALCTNLDQLCLVFFGVWSFGSANRIFSKVIHFCINMCRMCSSVKDDFLCSDQGKGIKRFPSVWTMCTNFY